MLRHQSVPVPCKYLNLQFIITIVARLETNSNGYESFINIDIVNFMNIISYITKAETSIKLHNAQYGNKNFSLFLIFNSRYYL